jgi:CheY-like chemotaxis protein
MMMARTSVLVVDDRPDVRLSLLYMLEASGYDVAEAGDGRQALAALARKRVDLILTDLYMPVMDGLGLVRSIRERQGPRPGVIAMSGSGHLGRDASLEAAQVLGADAVLRKPFTREQLINTITSVLVEPQTKKERVSGPRPATEARARALLETILRDPDAAASELETELRSGGSPAVVSTLLQAVVSLALYQGVNVEDTVGAVRNQLFQAGFAV